MCATCYQELAIHADARCGLRAPPATRIRQPQDPRVDRGRVYGDESWFDSQRTGPGWKASYYINECPPLSALIVDRGWYDRHTAQQPALAAAGKLKLLLQKEARSSVRHSWGSNRASG